jgi:hypothetical protein
MPAKPKDPREMSVAQKWSRIEKINATIDRLVTERKQLTDDVESAFARIKPINE